jgi:cysteine/histidine-rich domain-containing protein 1
MIQTLQYCYNRGCGKEFDINNNQPDSCQHHPGEPVFHDALKGWSCCDKKSTDFTQFLNTPGCTKSAHSNVKPAEPEKKSKVIVDELQLAKDLARELESKKPPEPAIRPTTNDAPLVDLKRTVAPSLIQALNKLSQDAAKRSASSSQDDPLAKTIAVGTNCYNATCNKTYLDESSNEEKCTFHSGVAIFHEGMKYWSCCQRKTSDFDSFLNQSGCTEARHLWFKREEKVDTCRHDFHQTGGFVVLTFYAKNPVPERTSVKANQISLNVEASFEGGTKSFTRELNLHGVIKVEESVVNFFGTKIEIKLKKADACHWTKLEF